MEPETLLLAWADAGQPEQFFGLMVKPLEGFLLEDRVDRLQSIFGYVRRLFLGEVPGYQACDTLYHDVEHTMECSLAMSRMISGLNKAHADFLTPERAEWGLVAVLLHDTGYIKTTDDAEGTGAKYTQTHVLRSAAFAARHMGAYGYSEEAIMAMQNMIRCTGFDVKIGKIGFQDEREHILGCCLGTADLLGQMASPHYLKKLPILYHEFAEAGIEGYAGEEDLMRKTPGFFRSFVMKRFEEDLKGACHFLEYYFPDGRNHYLIAIERNIAELEQRLGAGSPGRES
jgi:hypothetical protein